MVDEAPPGACYLVMTHSHALDLEVVERVLKRNDFRFLGLIGSETKAAKFRDMFVADLPGGKRFSKAFTVELRIGARPRHRPHVHDAIDARLLQQIGEFDDRPGGMAYGEDRRHVLRLALSRHLKCMASGHIL